MSIWLLTTLLVCKLAGTTFTLASGGSGGVFAPSLFLGAAAGGVLGMVLSASGCCPREVLRRVTPS